MLLITGSVAADHGSKTWDRTHRSIVSVMPTWPGYDRPGFGAPKGTAPEGSGIVFSAAGDQISKQILTAAHVVNKAQKVRIRTFDEQIFDAQVRWVDHATDIAVLSVESKLSSLPLIETPTSPGEHVCVIANPFGLGTSMSCGIISGLHRRNRGCNEIEDVIQTDAAVNPGSSGGALVDSEGQLLGMIAAIFTKEADIDAGVNFAISSSLLLARIHQFQNR